MQLWTSWKFSLLQLHWIFKILKDDFWNIIVFTFWLKPLTTVSIGWSHTISCFINHSPKFQNLSKKKQAKPNLVNAIQQQLKSWEDFLIFSILISSTFKTKIFNLYSSQKKLSTSSDKKNFFYWLNVFSLKSFVP